MRDLSKFEVLKWMLLESVPTDQQVLLEEGLRHDRSDRGVAAMDLELNNGQTFRMLVYPLHGEDK
jgi:hypothetical protein